MAAIPPIHEDPPVGTGGVATPGPDTGPGGQGYTPPQPGPMPDQQPNLPRDWSPVDPAPAA